MDESDKKCFICEIKGRSMCPSSGKYICSSCCGSKRGAQINCASDCPHYPFGIKGYDLWIKADISLAKKIMQHIVNKRGEGYFEKITKRMMFKGSSPRHTAEIASASAAFYIVFVERDKNNHTLGELWKLDGWQGLNNDEKILMECRLSSRVTIVEIQKILDNQAMECIDIFNQEKGKFIVFDRSMASQATRFTRLLTWLTHYPHFSRIENNGFHITEWIFRDIVETIKGAYENNFKSRPGYTIKDYMSEHLSGICEFGSELARKKSISMLNNADIHQCRAVYKITGSYDEIKNILDSYPDFKKRDRTPEEADISGAFYYSWFRCGESKAIEKKMNPAFRHGDNEHIVGTLGNVILLPDRISIETFSKQKFVFAKKMAEKYFGENVVFQGDIVTDLAKQLAQKIKDKQEWKSPDEQDIDAQKEEDNKIPIEIEREMLKDYYQKHYKRFLSDKIPMLNGKTPRQASKIPAMRPLLIELMKTHIAGIDKMNKEKNTGFSLDWVLDELGLDELK